MPNLGGDEVVQSANQFHQLRRHYPYLLSVVPKVKVLHVMGKRQLQQEQLVLHAAPVPLPPPPLTPLVLRINYFKFPLLDGGRDSCSKTSNFDLPPTQIPYAPLHS